MILAHAGDYRSDVIRKNEKSFELNAVDASLGEARR